jgi:hypothetical protein
MKFKTLLLMTVTAIVSGTVVKKSEKKGIKIPEEIEDIIVKSKHTGNRIINTIKNEFSRMEKRVAKRNEG